MKESFKEEEVVSPAVEETTKGPISNKELILNKGEERYQKTALFINGAGDKVKGWVKSGATKLGRFFKAAAIRGFAAPDAVQYGAKVTVEKIGEEASYAKEGAIQGAKFVGGKIVEGVESVTDDIGQARKWIENKAISIYDTSVGKVQEVKDFTANKAEQVQDYIKDKALLAEAIGSLIKEKTRQQLDIVGDKVSDGFEKVTIFGMKAVESAKLKAQNAKDTYNMTINTIKRDILERKAKIQKEKLERTLNKLKQLETVGKLEANMFS